MNYTEAVDFLYSQLPMFQTQGARAYKPGLSTTLQFCEHLGNPHTKFKSVHVGGTNGKGSTSHMLAAILQQAGYKTGLYTSPHLKSFTERIRINGQPVSENYVAGFVSSQKSYIEISSPSFFETTVAMAFDYFASEQVDIAIIEVGMGGRLDSTNVITPLLSVITNISWDHMQYLGNTLPDIAKEKAGIIKENIPVVVSEYQGDEIMDVFVNQCFKTHSHLRVAAREWRVIDNIYNNEVDIESVVLNKLVIHGVVLGLKGGYQLKNLLGVLSSIDELRQLGYVIPDDAIRRGIEQVTQLTGLKGRWQLLRQEPLMVCDTAHNYAGLKEAIQQFTAIKSSQKRLVIGFLADKDVNSILSLLPKDAIYYFCQPSNSRALDVGTLKVWCEHIGLKGSVFTDVNLAIEQALLDSAKTDTIYIGGSTFVVADIKQL